MERFGEEKYNLVTNYCEHFAMWCKTGESVSCQVNQIVGFAVIRGMKGFYGYYKDMLRRFVNILFN